MKKKFNQKLLNEELKKFRLLSEYTFYNEKTEDDNDLILGAKLGEADEDPAQDPVGPVAGDDSKTSANAAPDAAPADAEQPADAEAPVDAEQPADAEAPADDENMFGTGDEAGGEEMGDEMGGDEMDAEQPAEDEVEVDVTQLVKGNEEATDAANDASQKTSELLAKFSELEQRVSTMSQLSQKIDTLEKEIVKRNPTPVEKLEMRSMDSYPYNIKLTDFWKDVQGYKATDDEPQKPEEYVLTKDDVDTGFTDASIKNTFNIPDEYEEEDI